MAIRRIRYLALVALGVFVALPVARVHTAGAPWIQRMELRSNDLVALHGKGVPGTAIEFWYRQRNFRQGVPMYLGPYASDYFEWCAWLNAGNAIHLGSTQVSGAGTWQIQGLDLQVLPGQATWRTCATGVLTEIELRSQYGNASVPQLGGLYISNARTGDRLAVYGQLYSADQAAAGVADGPNDVQNATSPWTIDTDENGTDLCASAACGSSVTWGWYLLIGADTPLDLQPPSIQVRDDSPLVGPRDQEFGHVMGMIQGHKPGGSVLAAAYVPRSTPVGPAFNVNLNLDGGGGEGLGCDAGGGYFDFVP